MAAVTARDLDFAETAPVRAEGSAVLDASPAEVWAVLLDYQSWPTWFNGVKACRSTSELTTGVGSTREVWLPGGATVQERFIAWEDEALWAFTADAISPRFARSLVERVTITEVAPGLTSVTYRMAFEPVLALKVLAPLARRAIGRNLTGSLERLGEQVRDRR